MHFNSSQMGLLDKRYRAALINSLAGFRQVVLVGTCNAAGKTNLAVFNSLIHLGADPPLYGLVSRPDSVERHTLENIRDGGCWTVNFVPSELMKQAHLTSARFPKEVSEFDACGFTAEFRENFPAPFVKESPVQVSLELEDEIRIAKNNTVLLVGAVKDIYLPDDILGEDGYADLQKKGLLLCSGLDGYHTATPPTRLPYAKVPGQQTN